MTVARGCGTRKRGAIYAEVATSPFGLPLNYFLIDPPIPIPPGLRITPVGVTLIPDPREYRECLAEAEGDQGAALAAVATWHVLDWVGAEHYPNVADVWEEGRRLGFSRRLPKTLEFDKLTPSSRLVLAHGRATLVNAATYRAAIVAEQPATLPGGLPTPVPACPKRQADHEQALIDPGEWPRAGGGQCNRRMCCGLWWHDLDPNTCDLVLDPSAPPRQATRQMPSFAYTAHRRSEEVIPDSQPGLFASLPLGRLVVIRDSQGQTHEAARATAERSALPVSLEEE